MNTPLVGSVTPLANTPFFQSASFQGMGQNTRFSGVMDTVARTVYPIALPLEQNPQLNLAVTDIAGMTAPRSMIELKKRGLIAGQETFFREILGMLSLTYMTGWLGMVVMQGFRTHKMNPLRMDFGAWIDATSLDAFQKTLSEVIRTQPVKTGEQLQKAFLKTVFERLDSTDTIAKLSSTELRQMGIFDFSHYFPNKGKLSPEHVNHLVDIYVHGHAKTPGTPNCGLDPHRAFNVEKLVKDRLKQAVHQNDIEQIVTDKRTGFMANRNPLNLSESEKKLLKIVESKARREAIIEKKLALRRVITSEIRGQEAPFIKTVHDFTINHGKMTEHVALVDDKGHRLYAQSLKDWLEKTKYYMEEFLNRSLADPLTGEIPKQIGNLSRLQAKLFPKQPLSMFERWFPQAVHTKDSLINYAYKSKLFLSIVPFVIALAFAGTTVIINNYLTRRRIGSSAFPGELALLEQEKRRLQERYRP